MRPSDRTSDRDQANMRWSDPRITSWEKFRRVGGSTLGVVGVAHTWWMGNILIAWIITVAIVAAIVVLEVFLPNTPDDPGPMVTVSRS